MTLSVRYLTLPRATKWGSGSAGADAPGSMPSEQSAVPGRVRRKARGEKVDEGAHLGRRTTVGQVDRMHRRGLDLRLVERKRDQRAGAQIIGDDEGWLPRQSLAGQRYRAQRIAIVGAQIAGDLDADLAIRAEQPFRRARLLRKRVAEAIMRGEVGHAAWRAVLR